jgi:adenylate kinase
MRVVVTGVPGVGKTTVMDSAAKRMGMRIVNYGTVMFEVASQRGLVKHRDEIRKMNIEDQKSIQQSAAEKIYAMGDVIVDTHCTIKTSRGYFPGLPEWVLRALKPDVIVLIESTPEEIAQRRARDTSRTRDPDILEEIQEHQMMNRFAAMAYAALTGASVKIVKNHENRVEEAVDSLLKIF